jgi:hypothetical protein
MIQDYMLFLFTHHIVFTGYAWGVWGLLACSLLSTPFLSFSSTLALTSALPCVIVIGSLVGSPVGVGEFEVNSLQMMNIAKVLWLWFKHSLVTTKSLECL